MNVSDRIAVIYDGQIVDTVLPKETTEQELGLLMAGQRKNNKANKQGGVLSMSNRVINILVPVISVIIRFTCWAVVMLVSGYDPVKGYIALWNGIFGDAYTIGETIRQITPYLLSGLAVAFAFRTGLFNIGVEGQLIVGWFAAAYVGLHLIFQCISIYH